MSSQWSSEQLEMILAASSQQCDRDFIVDILAKSEKTSEEAKFIFDKIKSFSFFQNFFSHYVQDMDLHSIFSLCKEFRYEKYQANSTVFLQKDQSNRKFYVVLSGEIAVCIKNESSEAEKEAKETKETEINLMNELKINLKEQTKSLTSIAQAERTPSSRRKNKRFQTQLSLNTSFSEEPRATPGRAYQKSIFGPKSPNKEGGSLTNLDQALLRKGTIENNLENPLEGEDPFKRKKSRTSLFSFIYQKNGELNERDGTRTPTTRLIERKSVPSLCRGTPEISEIDRDEEKSFLEENDFPMYKKRDLTEEQQYQFEKKAESLGKIVRTLKEGEGFGEIALKRNIPRTASILCKTDCEFLTLTKEQYELGFGRMQNEKEDFLNSVFPMLKTYSASVQLYNHLLYTFKTERHPKGTHLVSEGRLDAKEGKFFIIQQGECIIEKQLIESNDTFASHHKLIGVKKKATITVVGKGVILGEELLLTKDEYQYTVKVTSDMVIVQAVSVKEFRQKFPTEFRLFIEGLYEKKRVHREGVVNQLKKENKQKIQQYKIESAQKGKSEEIKEHVLKTMQNFRKQQHKIARTTTELTQGEELSSFKHTKSPGPLKTEGVEERARQTFRVKEKTIQQEKLFPKENHKGRKNKKDSKPDLPLFASEEMPPWTKLKIKVPQGTKTIKLSTEAIQIKAAFYDPEIEETTKTVRAVEMSRNSLQLPKLQIDDFKHRVSLDSLTVQSARFSSVPPLQLNESIKSPLSSLPQAGFLTKRVSHSEFKSLYTQTLVKGPVSLKSASLGLRSPISEPNCQSARIADSSQKNQKDLIRKRLFLMNLNTYDSETASLEALTPKSTFTTNSAGVNSNTPDDSSQEPQKSGTSSFISVTTDNRKINIFKQSAFAGDKKMLLSPITQPDTSPKKQKQKPGNELHVHKVKDWRMRVFKKTLRKTNKGDDE